MSQWNNSHSFNHQCESSNTWNGDVNSQYVNQPSYPNGQYGRNSQYVSFDDFTSQMQGQNVAVSSTSGYPDNRREYQHYPLNQISYQSMPAAAPDLSQGSSNHSSFTQTINDANGIEAPWYHMQNQSKTDLSDSNTFQEIVLNSNLTPTATEFIPKTSKVKQSLTEQNFSRNEPSTSKSKIVSKQVQSASSDMNWRDRPQNTDLANVSQYNQSNHRLESNGRTQERYKSQEPASYSRDTKTRNNESSIRNDHINNRHQSKSNSKARGKDSDNRTFYNSTINKTTQDVRNGRGEGSNRQQRNWAGSQRLRVVQRNYADDEQYANSYLQGKEERYERNKDSPVRNRNKYNGVDQTANTEMTQRERLSEQLDSGVLECLVCCERVKQVDPVWSCGNCYHVLHLRCIRKWALSSLVEGKWRCPACQNTSDDVPSEYRCMCGSVRSPDYQRGAAGAHTCGKTCKRARNCPHPCTLLCHPGPCPPCQATINKQCGCGAETRSVLCSSKLPQVCGRVCGRTLECGAHKCARDCHEGVCDQCTETVSQVCYCPAAKSRTVDCSAESGACGTWSCAGACGRVLECGAHVCRASCHPPPCDKCRLLPAAVITCPCGKMKLNREERKSCTDPIPVCGNICAKQLPCGPATDRHICKVDCHEGPCPVCPDKTLLQCRCGHSSREVPCVDLPDMLNNVLCQKKCNKKLSCGRHRCRTVCCAASSHRCAVVCARALSCQLHRCEEFCHTGHCAPCPRLSFSELRCECGAEVSLPPVRCGARPPACSAPCRRARPCGHEPHHACHAGDCPPCVVLTTKHCYGDHEERKTIPCSQEEFSCGMPCGKPLPCGKHTCIKICHKGPCDTGKCSQPCTEKRATCGHPCAAPCHMGTASACPSTAPCRRTVRATCLCGRRTAERTCADNARDLNKIMSTLAATKMQEGGSVDLSEVQRPASMLKTLECDDECRMEARSRQLALALQIRNPDVSAKLAPRYSEHVRTTATKDAAFAQNVHDHLADLVQRAKKSKQKTRSHSFPSMNWQKRQFIHELCEHFGCESVAYDAEPNRNVVATADREKSWLPAMSVLEVLAREAGKRRVPGPVLRAPPQAAASTTSNVAGAGAGVGAAASAQQQTKSSGGWATLTSTNAWAARSQAKLQQPIQSTQLVKPATPSDKQPANKIDYFDSPPEN